MFQAQQLNWVRTGTAHAETVVFIHAVGYDLTYWDRQIEALHDTYNVVAFDLPGHGRSPGQAQDWSFDHAAATIAELIQFLSDKPVHLAGISFGGMIAQTLALAYPHLVRSLTLIGTASTFPQPARNAMKDRAQTVRAGGMAAVLASSLQRWFTPATIAQRPDIVDRVTKTILADDPAVHAAIWDIIANFDVYDRLAEIACPTLILVGEQDSSTPPAAASALARGIRGSRLVIIPNAAHILNVEAPFAVNAALQNFLADPAD